MSAAYGCIPRGLSVCVCVCWGVFAMHTKLFLHLLSLAADLEGGESVAGRHSARLADCRQLMTVGLESVSSSGKASWWLLGSLPHFVWGVR